MGYENATFEVFIYPLGFLSLFSFNLMELKINLVGPTKIWGITFQ